MNKSQFSEGLKSVEKLLNEIEELIYNEDFRKAAAKTAQQIGISPKEWNENKVAILTKFASQIVLNN